MPKSEGDLYQRGADRERLVASRRAIAASWMLVGVAAAVLVVGPAADTAAKAAIVALQHEVGAVAAVLQGIDAAI